MTCDGRAGIITLDASGYYRHYTGSSGSLQSRLRRGICPWQSILGPVDKIEECLTKGDSASFQMSLTSVGQAERDCAWTGLAEP